MKDSESKNKMGSQAAANQAVQKKGNGLSLPSAATTQLQAPMQGKFEGIQKAEEEKEMMQGKFEGIQKEEEEKEMMQGKFEGIQKEEEEKEMMQGKFEGIQKEEEEKEMMQGKFEGIQKEEEEKEMMQGKFEGIQKVEEEKDLVQGKFETAQKKDDAPAPANNTGMPDNLKSGIENLSGMDMGDVRVNYNSEKPKEMGALAYAQGNNIQIGPGQEKHLGHEAWHVVQQRQGRVQATKQMKEGVPVNDDPGLENEADVMGAKALKS